MLLLHLGSSVVGRRSNRNLRCQSLRVYNITNYIPVLFFLLLLSRPRTTRAAAAAAALECELYIAESTIPNAGIGIYSGIEKLKNDLIGNGDKAIPVIDVKWHNGQVEDFFDPLQDFTWDGTSMGMTLENYSNSDLAAFWPGIDAMVNCNSGLLNTEKAVPVYDDGVLHRYQHPGAGAITPYNADQSIVVRDIPIGGELFKNYGELWFLSRNKLGQIPVESHHGFVLDLMSDMIKLLQGLHDEDDNEIEFITQSILFDELIKDLQNIWNSRMLNALYDFTLEDIKRAIDINDIGFLLQKNATRSIEWLNINGRCIDHIVQRLSTIEGAGHGAFAKRNIPKDTIVTGTPLIYFPSRTYFDLYDYQVCEDGRIIRNITDGPYGQQLLINYCFDHPQSTFILCPYGSGINYINHNKTRANVKIQWSEDGIMNHRAEWLLNDPKEMIGTHLAIDYVALRDIVEGEELFLNYGDVWEDKWNKRIKDWEHCDDSYPKKDYVSATEYNVRYSKDPILTSDEQLLEPYPDNLLIRCHYLLETNTGENFDGNISMFSDWNDYSGDYSGVPCQISKRYNSNGSYRVSFKTPDNGFTSLSGVPREAIKFADSPYTTDLHMIGVFREPLGIPDDIFPDAWRIDNIRENQTSCRFVNDEINLQQQIRHDDDPCAVPDEYIEIYDNIPSGARSTHGRTYRGG